MLGGSGACRSQWPADTNTNTNTNNNNNNNSKNNNIRSHFGSIRQLARLALQQQLGQPLAESLQPQW